MAAGELEHKLTNMGFQDEEAQGAVLPKQPALPGLADYPLFGQTAQTPLLFVMESKPDFSALGQEDLARVKVEPHAEGGFRVQVSGTIDEGLAEKIVKAVPREDRDSVRRAVEIHRFVSRSERSPAERGVPFRLPRLCMMVQGELEPVEKESIFAEFDWNLKESCEAAFAAQEVALDQTANTWSVDIKGNRIQVELVGKEKRDMLPGLASNWDELKLVRWLDKQIHQPDIAQPVMLEFIRLCLASLIRQAWSWCPWCEPSTSWP